MYLLNSRFSTLFCERVKTVEKKKKTSRSFIWMLRRLLNEQWKKKRKICIISNFDTDTDIIGFFVFFPFCLRFCSALRTLYLRSFETNKFFNEWIINRFLFCFYFVFKTIKILILFFFWKRVVFYIDGNHFLSVPNYIQQILSISI